MIKQSTLVVALCLALTANACQHHHHNNRLLGYENGFNTAEAVDANTVSGGAIKGNGNSYVQLAANNKGAQVAGTATDGMLASTGFVQNYKASAVNSGFNVDKDNYGNVVKSNGFNTADAQVLNTAANTQAYFGGNGQLITGSGMNGISGTAAGTNGSGVAGNFGQQENSSKNANGFNIVKRVLADKVAYIPRKKHVNSDSCEDNNGWNSNFADKSATKAAATSESFGNGYSSLSLGKKGAATEGFGTKGAGSKSAFEQQNNSWISNNGFANKGGKHFGFNDDSASNNNTQAFTDANAYGEGGVKTAASKDGADVFAKGALGTQNKGGWNNSDDNWAKRSAFTKNRRLSVAIKEDIVTKKMVDDLKAQLVKVKLENEKLKKLCAVKKLGATQ